MSLSDQIEYWAKVAGRPITKFEQMVLARPFKYSSYWRTWNRVLKPVYGGQPYGYVEFSLEPINGWIKVPAQKDIYFPETLAKRVIDQVANVGSIRIRQHSTLPDPKDKYSSSIPDELLEKMKSVFGEDHTQYMLYGNIFDRVDWDKYRSTWTIGGGIALEECGKNIGTESMRDQ